jgi:hypothetical protein
MQFATTCHT